MSSYLQLSGVNKSFGDFTALHGVDLAIEKGEFVTFLGPSGSGKTTTLMIIAGFERPSGGDVLIEGRSLSGLAPHERNIGIVFQNYALFPHKTAADNVYFPLQMRGVDRTEGLRKANDMLDLVGLKGFSHRYPKELSGGQQQRVALARALVFEPSLLLLDEPLGALDKNLREQMQIEIKRIQRSLGVTTIFVTHDQSEAMSMSDRIVVFEQGVVQQAASPLEIYRHPSTRFVAGFVGESNLVPAIVSDVANGRAESAALGRCSFAPTSRLAQGDEVALLIRPESIRLSPVAVGDHNEAEMRVETIVNYGDNALVIGQVGELQMRARILGAEVGVKEGETCHISWPAEAVYAIPPSSRHSAT